MKMVSLFLLYNGILNYVFDKNSFWQKAWYIYFGFDFD